MFLVVAIEVEKRRSGKNGKNGRKWWKMGCRGKMAKMDFRGKMAGNGFSRVLRHGSRGSPVDNGRNGRIRVAAVIW